MTASPADVYGRPGRTCNVVMKGGVTSGVVYPPAVLALARHYRFECVGGTSAGAIAAALAAAAEFARQRGDAGGFARLDDRARALNDAGALRDLFAPAPELAPCFTLVERVLLTRERREALLTLPRGRGAAAWIRYGMCLLRRLDEEVRTAFPGERPGSDIGSRWVALLAMLAGTAVGVLCLAIVALVLLAGASPSGAAIAAAVLLPAIAAAVLAWRLGRTWLTRGAVVAWGASEIADRVRTQLPRYGFGLCPGVSGDADGRPGFSEWLHASLQHVAGSLEHPLTLGDLAGEGVVLQVVTSNLSQGRPFLLPLVARGPGAQPRFHVRLDREFAANLDELRPYFPTEVLDHLHAKRSPGPTLPHPYVWLPPAAELPVAFVVRLSLSFPGLFGAVPLYTRRQSAEGKPELTEADLARNWFSDGGISSNFPIRLFDEWLPRHPTFGFMLESLPVTTPDVARAAGGSFDAVHTSARSLDDAAPRRAAPDAEAAAPGESPEGRVYLPRADSERSVPVAEIATPLAFAAAIWNTAQNYRDVLQAELPSYRERIVQVRLAHDEGGLNLAMTPATIGGLQRIGTAAGEAVVARFATGDRAFDEHRWVRLRVLLAELEHNFGALARALGEPGVQAVLDEQDRAYCAGAPATRFPYACGAAWTGTARQRLDELHALARSWSAAPVLHRDLPRPAAKLRLGPSL